MSNTRAAIIGPMRPNFLLLTPACVVLGLAVAHWRGFAMDWGQFLLVLAGAVASHIAVNALNEYADFRSGLDLTTTKTPFSGGTGTLPANPDKAHYALITGVVSVAVTAAIGVYFVVVRFNNTAFSQFRHQTAGREVICPEGIFNDLLKIVVDKLLG